MAGKDDDIARYAAMIGDPGVGDLAARLMNVPNLAGLFYPEARGAAGHVRYGMVAEDAAKPLAERVPAPPLRHYYGVKDGRYLDDLYLASGQADIKAMLGVLGEDGFDPLAGAAPRIMDFGCSAGRMLRHLEHWADRAELWGVDLHEAAVHWAQEHLSPPFHFMTNTTAPHLPFEDCSFDLIYAGSVWTHIGALDDAWFLELRRILRPGGRLYITISDEETLEEIRRVAPDHPSNALVAALEAETGMFARDWRVFVTRSTPWLQRVVYRRDPWLARIGRWMQVRLVRPRAYGWQTGVLLEKRS